MTPVWGEVINGARTYRLHAGQSDIIRHPARFLAAVAGTGGGKTVTGPLWMMMEINRLLKAGVKPPIKALIVAPTYPVMARATRPTFLSAFKGTDFEGKDCTSKNYYLLPDGLGIVWTLSADNPDGLEGGQFHLAWIDEGGQVSLSAWVAIQGRLGQHRGRCLVTTTPYAMNWLYKEFYLRWKAGDKDYYVRQWNSAANPAYSREEMERARKTMSPQRFAMRYEGEFVKMAGLVYPDLRSCVRPFDNPSVDADQGGGIDFGWNDPFCGLAAYEEDGVLHVYFERYKRFNGLDTHAANLPKDVTYYADASRPDSIFEMRKADVLVRPNKVPNIVTGVGAVYSRIYDGTLLIHPRCKALLAESDEYHYPEKDDVVQGENPVGGFDHAMDALRYLVANYDKGRIAEAA